MAFHEQPMYALHNLALLAQLAQQYATSAGGTSCSCSPVFPFPGPASVKALQLVILCAFACGCNHLLLLAGLVCCLA